MKKPLIQALEAFANSYKKMANEKLMKFKNELTPDQIAMLGEEISSLTSLTEKLTAMAAEDPENEEVKKLQQMVADLQTALSENQTAFENKILEMLKGKSEKTFVNFIEQAIEKKIFENSKNANEEIGRTYFKNAAGINVVYNDTEVGVTMSQVPTLLDYIRQIRLNGETTVMWNEVDGTTDASAVVAVGAAKPVRTVAHSYSSATTDTIAVISKLPIQYAKSISMLADIYLNEMSKDIYRKLNAVLIALLAAGSDLADLGTIQKVDKPQMIDAIKKVASAITRLYPENRVVIGLSADAIFELNSVKDANGNYIVWDFKSAGIDIVTVPVVGEFTATSIIGMSQNVLRWYNDGVVNKTSEHAYWANNQIGLMQEVLFSTMVLRATDAKATVFDDYTTIIEDMTVTP